MRVLHVITGLQAGGAEQWLRLVLRHSRATADVVSLTTRGTLADALEADGVRVTAVGMRGNRDLAALPRLARIVRRGRYDVVHTHLYRAQVFGPPAARAGGVGTVVSTEHSLNDRLIEGRPVDRPGVRGLYLAANRLTAATVAVSEPVAQRLAAWGVPAEKIVIVPVGVDVAALAFDPAARDRVRAELGLAPGTTVVGGVGRLVPPKRFDVLLRAVAPRPAMSVLLVGDGTDRAACERLAAELGMTDRVVFAGQRLDVPALLSAMDVFASPSPEETFGVAVLEALVNGLPTAYAAAPALAALPPSAMRRAVCCPPEPEALGRALDALAGAPRRAAPAGGFALYDVAASAARIDATYERCLGSSRPPREVRHG